MVRVGGPRVSHGTITVNSVRVVTVISVGGVQLTRVSGAVRGSRVCSLRFVWVEPGPCGRLPWGCLITSMIIALRPKHTLISA